MAVILRSTPTSTGRILLPSADGCQSSLAAIGTCWMSGELGPFGGAGQGNGCDSYGPDIFLNGTNRQIGQNLSIAATFATRWTLAPELPLKLGRECRSDSNHSRWRHGHGGRLCEAGAAVLTHRHTNGV
jgi:hypothetical protein